MGPARLAQALKRRKGEVGRRTAEEGQELGEPGAAGEEGGERDDGAAGIAQPISRHTLRHACATHLLQGGADVRHVQKLLGHAGPETTVIYTRVETSDLRRALGRAHPREQAWNEYFHR